MSPEQPQSPEENISEGIPCLPDFVKDVKEGVDFVMGCNNKFDHFSDIGTFGKYLIHKYGKETCMSCPAFHVLIHSTPPEDFEGMFEDFGGEDSIKKFLAHLGNKCQRRGEGCEACQACKT